AFRHGLHGAFRILDIEQELPDPVRLHLPQHREVNINDVLVAGEHQAFLRHITNCSAAATDIVDHAHADIDLVDAQSLGRKDGLHRIRQVVVQTGLDHAHLLAEAQHNPQLVRLDPKEPRKSPQCKHAKHEEGEAAAAQIAARQHAPQLVLTTAQYFF